MRTVYRRKAVFQALREDSDSVTAYAVDPLKFVTLSGNSLDVTEVVVKYRSIFTPYTTSYLRNELTFAFSPHDLQHYFRGRELGHDVSVLLDASAFDMGLGNRGIVYRGRVHDWRSGREWC